MGINKIRSRDKSTCVVEETAPIDGCPVGGFDVVKEIGGKLGQEVKEAESIYPFVRCNGGVHCTDKIDYVGIEDCRAVMMISDGEKGCSYGCVGQGTCVRACPFGAITIGDDRLPHINKNMCKSCAICVDECPNDILVMASDSEKVHVLCRSNDKGKLVKSQRSIRRNVQTAVCVWRIVRKKQLK
jgi:electron transport complex protein RnfB